MPLLPNSATSTHILTSNLVVKDIEEIENINGLKKL